MNHNKAYNFFIIFLSVSLILVLFFGFKQRIKAINNNKQNYKYDNKRIIKLVNYQDISHSSINEK